MYNISCNKSCEKMHMAIVLSKVWLIPSLVSPSRPGLMTLVLVTTHTALKTIPYAYLLGNCPIGRSFSPAVLVVLLERLSLRNHRVIFFSNITGTLYL